ncbi:hypothetical protein EVAR_60622_1 [Eumeta japonica]|uniref:Uncharacterized protein n=1 Tax=Eumeta variegata TaxID=151549 RepID=A0A4C1SLM5_EUMVA|nr:hypothetical protein EVAR_60622_1 [Eumeta japonica]
MQFGQQTAFVSSAEMPHGQTTLIDNTPLAEGGPNVGSGACDRFKACSRTHRQKKKENAGRRGKTVPERTCKCPPHAYRGRGAPPPPAAGGRPRRRDRGIARRVTNERFRFYRPRRIRAGSAFRGRAYRVDFALFFLSAAGDARRAFVGGEITAVTVRRPNPVESRDVTLVTFDRSLIVLRHVWPGTESEGSSLVKTITFDWRVAASILITVLLVKNALVNYYLSQTKPQDLCPGEACPKSRIPDVPNRIGDDCRYRSPIRTEPAWKGFKDPSFVQNGTPQNATSRLDVHHTNLVVRTRVGLLNSASRPVSGDDESTISTMSPLGRRAAYRVASARRGTRVGGILSTTSARSDRRGADTCASLQARGARCRQWPAAAAPQEPDQEVVRREALGLGRFDVHLRQRSELTMCSASSSRAPPMFGAPGGMNFQVMVRTSAFLHLSCTSCMFISSLSAPTKFVPLTEYITLGVPLRAMNRRKASIMESDDKDPPVQYVRRVLSGM